MLQGKDITSKEVIEKINKDSELNLRVRTNKYDLSTTNFLTGRDLKVGVNAPYEFEGKFYVIKVAEVIDPKTKEFHEAKGAATSDYQNELERIWLEQLKAKHKIKVNEEVLYSLGK